MINSAFRNLFANMSDAVIFISDGHIVWGNETAEKMASVNLEGVNADVISNGGFREIANACSEDSPYEGKIFIFGEEHSVRAVKHEETYILIIGGERGLNTADQNLIGDTGYEFRSPLTMIMMSLHLISSRLKDEQDESIRKYLSVINQSCYRMLRISNNLTDLSKYMSNKIEFYPENGNLTALCRDLLDSAGYYVSKLGIEINFSYSDEVIVLTYDRQKIERMIYCLISNAVRHSKCSLITVKLNKTNGKVYLSVHDNGIGIPMEGLETVMDKYAENGDKEMPSLSLGLSLVKHIARRHDGAVVLTSREDAGTTVTVSLPIRWAENDQMRGVKMDYAGGINHALLELSDLLPSECYAI